MDCFCVDLLRKVIHAQSGVTTLDLGSSFFFFIINVLQSSDRAIRSWSRFHRHKGSLKWIGNADKYTADLAEFCYAGALLKHALYLHNRIGKYSPAWPSG